MINRTDHAVERQGQRADPALRCRREVRRHHRRCAWRPAPRRDTRSRSSSRAASAAATTTWPRARRRHGAGPRLRDVARRTSGSRAARRSAARPCGCPRARTGARAAQAETCSSGAHTLAPPGDRVYPDIGNGGYASVHSDVFINYDALTNLFLPGTHVDLQQRSTQCLSDFSLDFDRHNSLTSTARPGPGLHRPVGHGQRPAGDVQVRPADLPGRSRTARTIPTRWRTAPGW